MENTPMTLTSEIKKIFDSQERTRKRTALSDFHERRRKLLMIQNYIIAHQDKITQVLHEDLRKPRHEAILSEVIPVTSEIRHVCRHLKRWMKPQQVPTPLSALGTDSYIHYEAKGRTLLIAPWNYPFSLVLKPLIFAIAAGCTAIIKPSEYAPATSYFLCQMIKRLFDEEEIAVVEGDMEVAQILLKLPFDHIFFTGSPGVGKIVMKSAAENLTSVTLELGGKSPLVIDDTVNIAKVADKIIWAKFLNNGQTCIAPDYILVHTRQKDQLITQLTNSLQKMYNEDGNGIENSGSYGRIINTRNFQRLHRLLTDAVEKGAEVSFGGRKNEADLYFEPTLLTHVTDNMHVMQEEIFGPVLPVLSFSNLEEAIIQIQNKPKPLALYIMSERISNQQLLISQISAGGVMVNDFLQHFANPELPFGGISNSGMGKSNGFYGFQEFSNAKGIMKRHVGTIRFLFPPYKTGYQSKILNWLVRYF